MSQPGRPQWLAREKVYGWYRVYKGFPGHKKFRAVARATGIELCRVQMVVACMLEEASESKPRGSLVDFDVYDCAATLEIEPEEVARVYAELEHRQWISNDRIATWDKRQPDREDPGAAARKRTERVHLKDRRHKLAKPPVIELPPADEAGDDAKISRVYWLQTIGRQAVANRLNINPRVAEVLIGGWVRDARKDHQAVAIIIGAVVDQGLEGEGFRNVVAQKIRDLKREQEGPALPLGFTALKGGIG
jgi:hypothetical protein